MDEREKLLTVQQAASLLGINPGTLRRWAQSGNVKGVKIGTRGDWRFTREDLRKMLKRTDGKSSINKQHDTYAELKGFLINNASRIQKLAIKHHKEFLGVKRYRKEIIEKYQEDHSRIVLELAKYLEQKNVKKDLTVFKKLAVKIAKDSVKDGLTIEEAADGIIFLKQALWEKVKKARLLKALTSEEFYEINHLTSVYIDIISSHITFVYHEEYIRTVLKEAKERKIAEQILKDERRYAEDIVETIREPLLVLDKDLRVVSANQSFYTTFQVSPRQTEGQLVYHLGNNQWHIPELRKLLEGILPHKKVFNNYEVKHTFPTIGEKTMLLNARRIDHVQLILLAIEDITERREAEGKVRETEKRYRTLIEKSTDVIALSDKQGKYTYVTPSIKQALGYTPAEFTTTNSFSKIHPDDVPYMNDKFKQLLATPGISLAIELRFRHKNGSWRWIETTATNLLNDPSVKAIVSNFRDITERKNQERQKDEFMGVVTHELKTPVTSLKAFGQVLQSRFAKAGDEKSVLMLNKMDAQINKLTVLIADLLDATKIEGGQLQFHNEFFYFDELVDSVIEEMQLTTEKHKLVKKGKTGKTIYADRDRIGQVIANFLTNAIKYSPHSDKIIIKTSAAKEDVKLCVQDFGVGIPEEKLPHVFKRFYRVSGKTHDTVPGMGLGLYIASEIIKRQGGRIRAESIQGKGSTFCFSLPIKSNGEKQQKNTLVKEEMKHE